MASSDVEGESSIAFFDVEGKSSVAFFNIEAMAFSDVDGEM